MQNIQYKLTSMLISYEPFHTINHTFVLLNTRMYLHRALNLKC